MFSNISNLESIKDLEPDATSNTPTVLSVEAV